MTWNDEDKGICWVYILMHASTHNTLKIIGVALCAQLAQFSWDDDLYLVHALGSSVEMAYTRTHTRTHARTHTCWTCYITACLYSTPCLDCIPMNTMSVLATKRDILLSMVLIISTYHARYSDLHDNYTDFKYRAHHTVHVPVWY